MTRPNLTVPALALLAALAAPAAPAQPPRDSRATAPAPAEQPREIRTAEDLLRALERAGDGVRTLSANVLYDRRFLLQGDRHVREGRLYFAQQALMEGSRPTRAFGIHFETLYVGDRLENDPQTWVFDGRWLTESRPAEKRITRREMARLGENFDPLRVGEGPMPLPIGQAADEILAKYDAELLDARDGAGEEAAAYLPVPTHQLRLVPIEEREDLREIRLWYAKDTLLPRVAWTRNRAGDESFVVLANVRTNEPLPEGALRIDEQAAAADGWDVQVYLLKPAGQEGEGDESEEAEGRNGRGPADE